jgi:metallo-beta-lactamase family protein
MNLTFLGATGTVTGSKYGVRHGEASILVDCGLFQGYKQLRLRNWSPLPVRATTFNAVVLTHAHIDHSGYLPLLVKQGFEGPVYCTRATASLCEVLLRDSAHLQEEEAEYANRRGYSKHSPALPLFTRDDAEAALRLLHPVDFEAEFAPAPGMTVRMSPAGHILGAALVSVRAGGRTLVFSGDLGRPNDRIMRPPATVRDADWLVLESTYGDRRHDPSDPLDTLREVIERTAARGGVVIVPAFAVGRAQSLLHHLHLLKDSGRLRPGLRVYLDSPMAADVTDLYVRYRAEHRLNTLQCRQMCEIARFVQTPEESRQLDRSHWPMVIIAASGMATGGRVLHHLARFAPDPRNTILLTGFQAGGTRGATLLAGAKEIKIHGAYVPVRAEVATIENLSAHADYTEIIDWLRQFERAPSRVFLTHGEPCAADMLRRRIAEALGWRCEVPDYLESVELSR